MKVRRYARCLAPLLTFTLASFALDVVAQDSPSAEPAPPVEPDLPADAPEDEPVDDEAPVDGAIDPEPMPIPDEPPLADAPDEPLLAPPLERLVSFRLTERSIITPPQTLEFIAGPVATVLLQPAGLMRAVTTDLNEKSVSYGVRPGGASLHGAPDHLVISGGLGAAMGIASWAEVGFIMNALRVSGSLLGLGDLGWWATVAYPFGAFEMGFQVALVAPIGSAVFGGEAGARFNFRAQQLRVEGGVFLGGNGADGAVLRVPARAVFQLTEKWFLGPHAAFVLKSQFKDPDPHAGAIMGYSFGETIPADLTFSYTGTFEAEPGPWTVAAGVNFYIRAL